MKARRRRRRGASRRGCRARRTGARRLRRRGRRPSELCLITSTCGGRASTHLAVKPVEVHRLHAPRRERHRRQPADLVAQLGRREGAQGLVVDGLRPLVERRPVHGRTLAGHRVVDEQRDVFGHRVHPESRVQIRSPHSSGTGPMRVDQVDPEGAVGQQLGTVRREALEQRRSGRPGADERELDRRLRQLGAALARSPRWSRRVGPS